MDWFFGSSTSVPAPVPLSSSGTKAGSLPTIQDVSYYRDEGNKAFQTQQYQVAIEIYSKGIQAAPSAVLYSNRSAAYCAMEQYQLALHDANAAIELDSQWAKTYARKAKALYGLKQYQQSALVYAKAFEINLKAASYEAKQRQAELEAVQTQASNQTQAYLDLLKENKQLKNQVADYQHMFGDWAKKAT